jgi:hypothetical protein
MISPNFGGDSFMTAPRALVAADREGILPFGGYETWYRITAEIGPDRAPLVTLHGGPGCTDDYLPMMADPAERTDVRWDDVPESSHRPHVEERDDFMTLLAGFLATGDERVAR